MFWFAFFLAIFHGASQLLQFVPNLEEKEAVEANLEELEAFAKTERFFYEMTRVDHYEERLTSLYFQRRFTELIEEVHPKLEGEC